MARAHDGCGKFHPTNAPTAIHNMISNILRLLKFQGVVVALVHQRQVPIVAQMLQMFGSLLLRLVLVQRLVWVRQVHQN